MSETHFDLLVVGGGPAGAAAAITAASGGARVLVIERERFPREKVCGDCLHRDTWSVLERLGIAAAVRALPRDDAREFAFVPRRGRALVLGLEDDAPSERVIRRSHLDQTLLQAAAGAGAEVWGGESLAALRSSRNRPTFSVATTAGRLATAELCIAADGRNSTTARLLGLVRGARSADRVGLQTHLPRPSGWPAQRLEMRWFQEGGYGGFAPAANLTLNVAAAVPAASVKAVRKSLTDEFSLGPDHDWRVVAPLETTPRPPAREDGLFLAGDAARVVEPFTGEGIYYALRTGELAATHAIRVLKEHASRPAAAAAYSREHRTLYRGRSWVNRLARWAGTHPTLADAALQVARYAPGALRFLTAKVVGNVQVAA